MPCRVREEVSLGPTGIELELEEEKIKNRGGGICAPWAVFGIPPNYECISFVHTDGEYTDGHEVLEDNEIPVEEDIFREHLLRLILFILFHNQHILIKAIFGLLSS